MATRLDQHAEKIAEQGQQIAESLRDTARIGRKVVASRRSRMVAVGLSVGANEGSHLILRVCSTREPGIAVLLACAARARTSLAALWRHSSTVRLATSRWTALIVIGPWAVGTVYDCSAPSPEGSTSTALLAPVITQYPRKSVARASSAVSASTGRASPNSTECTLHSDVKQNRYLLYFSDKHNVHSNLESFTPQQMKQFRLAYREAKKQVAAVGPGLEGPLFSKKFGRTTFDFSVLQPNGKSKMLVISVTNTKSVDENSFVIPITWSSDYFLASEYKAGKAAWESLLEQTNY